MQGRYAARATKLNACRASLYIYSGGWTRTSDPVINSHLLYQLSYAGTSVERLGKLAEPGGKCQPIPSLVPRAKTLVPVGVSGFCASWLESCPRAPTPRSARVRIPVIADRMSCAPAHIFSKWEIARVASAGPWRDASTGPPKAGERSNLCGPMISANGRPSPPNTEKSGDQVASGAERTSIRPARRRPISLRRFRALSTRCSTA